MRLLAKLALWASLYTFIVLLGGHSYFVLDPQGHMVIPMGLFVLEKQLLQWLLHGSFACWVLAGLTGHLRLATWAGKVALGTTIVLVPAVLVMSWPRFLVPLLPKGARAFTETRMHRGTRPQRLFLGDPVLSQEVRA